MPVNNYLETDAIQVPIGILQFQQLSKSEENLKLALLKHFEELLSKYGPFNPRGKKWTYEELIAFNKAQSKTPILTQDNRTLQLRNQARQNAQYQQLRANEAQNYNNVLKMFGLSDMTTQLARANPDAIAEKMEDIKKETAFTMASAIPVIKGMNWLYNASKPAYYTLNTALTGLSAYDWYNDGANFGNVTGTILGGADLLLPTALKIYDNGTLWDKYTTLGGRFGYYGKPFLRVIGTVSRNLGLSSTPKHPELLRKIEGIPKLTDDGMIDFNSTRIELLGKGHSNWTLDRPVVSHNNGNWDGKDLFIVDPAAFKRTVPKDKVISIEPSDIFVHGANVYISPKDVTVVSGNPETLILARQLGMSTVSSPRLRKLFKPYGPKVGRFQLDKGNYGNLPYALEQLRLQQRRGAPTIEDFRLIEDYYGLDAGVIPISEYFQNSLSSAIRNMMNNPTLIGTWTYPNGRKVLLISGGTYLDKVLYEESLINKAPYKNVFYDPASHVEMNSGVTYR